MESRAEVLQENLLTTQSSGVFVKGAHSSHIYYECQVQSAKVLALPLKQAQHDNSNDTPLIDTCFCVNFPLLCKIMG